MLRKTVIVEIIENSVIKYIEDTILKIRRYEVKYTKNIQKL